MTCKQTTNTPINQEEDPCNGTQISTECITDPNALAQLGITADSTQSEINQAIQTAIYALSIANPKLITYTVDTLPSSPEEGTVAYVTDADSPTYLSVVSSGGSTKTPVFYNGDDWVCY